MSLIKQLDNYRLTTAEILYHMPDHPDLLQSYIWQEYDMAPKFPVLKKFLDFWAREIDGKLHSVNISSKGIISANDLGLRDSEYALH
ncbi:MAG TPA: Usg family protein [Rhodospirillaceae bacterium]|nr:Usg family protein [Alphaproteobacteria bacterium]OUT41432.1 MAG: Usg family protein [Micavibrio sp. TMED2]HCI45755.1 Usg family protein [Rhodospirillaceae bacterium]MAS47020.1 Usg family protein [Alphaproteobacteria bacterium]MAX95114.1 Usg family protein [Alphaproteobacteria bacterium]|tara:strand:- start:11933 stop:12193 length:261 start_codon:yes stop_codon:yes gene_type:complete